MAQQVLQSPIQQLSPPQALRRLREWQQQQQQELLLQQQRELLVLKNEQEVIRTRQGIRSYAQPSLSQNTALSSTRRTKSSSTGTTRLSQLGHQHPRNVTLPSYLNKDKPATRKSPSKGSPSNGTSPPSDKNLPKRSPTGSSPPIVGSLQPPGHTASGSSLTSTRSADSGMLSGQDSLSTGGQVSEIVVDVVRPSACLCRNMLWLCRVIV